MDIIKELKTNGLLLKRVPKKAQTNEICEIAITQNPLAIQFVAKKLLDSRLCLMAVKKDVQVFRYVPSQFITKEMCELVLEADSELLNSVPKVDRYELFDNKTEIALIKKVVNCCPDWLVYMPNRPDVREFCIKYMEKDFSVAQYMPDEMKVSEDILKYQKSKGKLKFVEKYYDSSVRKFKVSTNVVYEQFTTMNDDGKTIDRTYGIIAEFEEFNKFYDYLNGDISEAELGDYDFKGIDLKKYNIEGAVINSDILQSQGLYDGTYFSIFKKRMEENGNDVMINNEVAVLNEFCYPRPIEDEGWELHDYSHIPFFYISDIHLEYRILHRFDNKATKEEMHSYIKHLARKMVDSIGTKPFNSYLLIAGDTSSFWELTVIFYKELVRWWKPEKIIVVSGNHELWDPWVDMKQNIEVYRSFFETIGIRFLQNDLFYVKDYDEHVIIREKEILKLNEEDLRSRLQNCSIIILGGIGFSGLNKEYNASKIRYGKSFEDLSRDGALQKDKQEAESFNKIYKKLLKCLYANRVIVLTHTPKGDWNEEEYNSRWVYLNGHNHRNYCEVNDRCTRYADNQIGYKVRNIGLKYFYCDDTYDIFAYSPDGIYEITKEQYIDYNRGKMIAMSFNEKVFKSPI